MYDNGRSNGGFGVHPIKPPHSLKAKDFSLWTCPACSAINVGDPTGCQYCDYVAPASLPPLGSEPTAQQSGRRQRELIANARLPAVPQSISWFHYVAVAAIAMVVTGIGIWVIYL